MVNFKEEFKDVVDVNNVHVFCFGGNTTEEITPEKLMFAGGAKMFSSLCGFKFISKVNPTYNHGEFRLVFCVKLRSKIYRQANSNPSQWFAWIRVNNGLVEVLDKENCMKAFDFDIDKFFQTDLFQKWSEKFQKFSRRGLEMAGEMVKRLSRPKGHGTANDEYAYLPRYVKAISESIPLITSSRFNDKTYTLSATGKRPSAGRANTGRARYLAKKDAENQEAKKVNDVLNMPTD